MISLSGIWTAARRALIESEERKLARDVRDLADYCQYFSEEDQHLIDLVKGRLEAGRPLTEAQKERIKNLAGEMQAAQSW